MAYKHYALAAALALSTGAALADEPADEILVIGSLTPISASALGASVTTLDQDDIALRQPILAGDLLRNLPGLTVGQSGSFGGLTSLRIRGAEADHTLTFIDGIEAADPGSFGTIIDMSHLSSFDLGRVTVLRGGQSALYGADALGGVVSFETPGLFGADQTFAELEGGSFNTWRGGAGIARSDDTVSVRLSVNRIISDGDNAIVRGNEDDGYEATNMHGKLGIRLNEGLTFDVVALRQENRAEFDSSALVGGLFVLTDNPSDRTEFERNMGRAGLTYESQNKLWLGEVSAQILDSRQDTNGAITDGFRRKLDAQVSRLIETDGFDHRITLAARTETEKRVSSAGGFTRGQDSTIVEYRLIAEQGIALGASLRHDSNDSFKDKTTWHVDARARLREGWAAHASWGTGIKAPDFSELFDIPVFFTAGNPNLKPEESESWDIGLTHDFAHDGFSGTFDVTYFHADLTNEIQFVFVPFPGLSTFANGANDSKRQGVEAALELMVGNNTALMLGYTWLDAEDPNGDAEIRRPEHSAYANLSHRMLDDRLTGNLNVAFNGEMPDTDFSNGSRVVLDDYVLVDVALAYQLTDGFELTARADNLLDEDYQDIFEFVGLGRGVFVGLRASLGE